jgi:protein involved in polysaccharide export with SLBB domain
MAATAQASDASSGGAVVPMSGVLPNQTEVVQGERAAANLPMPVVALESPLDPDQYLCGSGDIFELNVWGRQNLKQRLTVDLEGRVFIPKVGYVRVAGRTLSAVREEIRRVVSRYFPGLQFDLSLSEPRTFVVHLAGLVARPGTYDARGVERASALLARAGGVAAVGSRRRIEIERAGNKLTVDLLLYQLTGETRYNPFVLDGDVLHIPQEQTSVTVGGAVARPGRYELVAEKDLAELVAISGGLTSAVTRELPILVARKGAGDHQVQSSVAWGANGALPSEALASDDIVQIPSALELQRSILLVGAIAGASSVEDATFLRRIPYYDGDTVRVVIERAGGVVAGADLGDAYILRPNGDQIPLDLEALLVRRDMSSDRQVQLQDSIVIPFQRRSVHVEGAVAHPGAYPYNPRFGTSQYVGQAGGLTRTSQPLENLRIITPDGRNLPYRADERIEPGYTIILPERDFSRAEVVALMLSAVGIALSAATVFLAAKK